MLIEPQRHSQLHILHLPEESTPPTDMHAVKGRFWDQLSDCHFVGEFDRDFLELSSFKRGLQNGGGGLDESHQIIHPIQGHGVQYYEGASHRLLRMVKVVVTCKCPR
jgi:hypothetical protein